MNNLSALILGLIQGFSEFLPISSSGHLVIAQSVLGFKQSGVVFDTILHAGTTAAVLWFYRDYLRKIDLKMIILLLIGTIPAGIVGVLFSSQIESLFSSVKIVGFALLVTAVMNYVTDKQSGMREGIDKFDAIIVGIAQSVAIIPGISRSGSTIFAATQMNIDRKSAARFSFLLSIPAIVGANALEIMKHGVGDGTPVSVYVIGFLAAFASGLLAIHFVIELLIGKKFKYFGLYAAIVGVIAIIFL